MASIDILEMAFDIYRTHWDRYILVDPNGEEQSPINCKLKEEADIKPTTQVRMGIEYIIFSVYETY